MAFKPFSTSVCAKTDIPAKNRVNNTKCFFIE
jgi:hypothetical protein